MEKHEWKLFQTTKEFCCNPKNKYDKVPVTIDYCIYCLTNKRGPYYENDMQRYEYFDYDGNSVIHEPECIRVTVRK